MKSVDGETLKVKAEMSSTSLNNCKVVLLKFRISMTVQQNMEAVLRKISIYVLMMIRLMQWLETMVDR